MNQYTAMASHPDVQYVNMISQILSDGYPIKTRNSLVSRLYGISLKFNTTPLISIRKTSWKLTLREWEWFMSGSKHIADLHPSVHHWWAPWVNTRGEVPANYSRQFRYFYGEHHVIDQIQMLIDGIKNHPNSRRNVITTWNTADMVHPDTPITNCHNTMTQAFVTNNRLDLVTYQRSVDVICGLPHNLIQMWAFLLWLAHRTNTQPGYLQWIGGDVHVYEAHQRLAAKMVNGLGHIDNDAPELVYQSSGEDFKADDFSLSKEYKPIFTDRAEMVV